MAVKLKLIRYVSGIVKLVMVSVHCLLKFCILEVTVAGYFTLVGYPQSMFQGNTNSCSLLIVLARSCNVS